MKRFIVLFVSLLVITEARAAEAMPAATAKTFNPDISVNFLGFWRGSSFHDGSREDRLADGHNGFGFQEAEIQFFADVDPYFRANALFALSPEVKVSDLDTSQTPSVVKKGGGFGLDPEEVFIETINLPVVSFKLGKFKAALGKHNTIHTHAYPFVDAPLINQDLLGAEGLNEVGISGSVLVPAPWFLEMTAQATSSNNDVLYGAPTAGDMAGVIQLRNLWDLADESTVEFSLFGTQGKNQASLTSQVGGADLIFKWRPTVGGKYRSLIFANEYLSGYSPSTGFSVGSAKGERLSGLASWIQFQFAERWSIQARAEFEGIAKSEELPSRKKQSALLSFVPSEFSGFRFQYDRLLTADQPTEHVGTLQWNITIGAHPAHSY